MLKDFGFVKVGEWKHSEKTRSGVTFVLNALKEERVIYAFLVNGDVKYVGVCDSSSTTLKDRMGRYRSMIGAGTNERVVGKIKECLNRGENVEILAAKPDKPFLCYGVRVDLVKGLENPLIEELKPEWNIHR